MIVLTVAQLEYILQLIIDGDIGKMGSEIEHLLQAAKDVQEALK